MSDDAEALHAMLLGGLLAGVGAIVAGGLVTAAHRTIGPPVVDVHDVDRPRVRCMLLTEQSVEGTPPDHGARVCRFPDGVCRLLSYRPACDGFVVVPCSSVDWSWMATAPPVPGTTGPAVDGS